MRYQLVNTPTFRDFFPWVLAGNQFIIGVFVSQRAARSLGIDIWVHYFL